MDTKNTEYNQNAIVAQNTVIWRLDELNGLINSFDEAIGNMVVERQIVEALDYSNILLSIAGKAIVTSREIICLTSYGFADGAMSLARTLYEHFIIVDFLYYHQGDNDFNDIIEDYYLDYHKSFNKCYRYSAVALGYDEHKSEIDESSKKNRTEAHHNYENGDYWWTGHRTFNDVVDDVQNRLSDEKLKNLYIRCHMLYKQACFSVHSNSFGNTWRLKDGSDYHGIDTCPSIEGQGLPLELAALSLLNITCRICKHFDIDYTAFQNGFNSLAFYYVDQNNQSD